ncbi:MAG: hypothetical protein WC477_06090 [Patescibacteria group bacterium]
MTWPFRIKIEGPNKATRTAQYTAKLYDWRGRVIPNEPVTWYLNPKVEGITVDSKGLLTIKQPAPVTQVKLYAQSITNKNLFTRKDIKIIVVIPEPEPIPPTGYSGVYGTWSNDQEIYVTNVEQCKVNDIISTPNSQIVTIDRIASNWIHTDKTITYWTGGKEILYLGTSTPPVNWYDVKNFAKGNGTDNDTAPIMAAQGKAKELGLDLGFPDGNYLIDPDIIDISCNWIAKGPNAWIITKENSLYNIMLMVRTSNIKIDGLKYDQMGDRQTVKPDSQGLKGCHILHISTANNIEICNCMTKGYGATSVFFQPPQGFGYDIKFHHNIGYWERQINQYYDATVFNTDGMSGLVYENDVIPTHKPGIVNWKPESGIEVHFPKLDCYYNRVRDCINGILPVNWPSQYAVYDPNFVCDVKIHNNQLTRVLRGVHCWGAWTVKSESRNIQVYDNQIDLYLEQMDASDPDQFYKPVEGVGFVDGGIDNCYFRNIEVKKNIIKTTAAQGLSMPALLDYGVPAEQLGAIYMMTNNSCVGFLVADNQIDFPYNTFQIRALQKKGVNKHEDIVLARNILTNPAIYHGWADPPTMFNAVYNYEHVNGVTVYGTVITGTPLDIRQDGAGVTNIIES